MGQIEAERRYRQAYIIGNSRPFCILQISLLAKEFVSIYVECLLSAMLFCTNTKLII